jgi:hypothetical protein
MRAANFKLPEAELLLEVSAHRAKPPRALMSAGAVHRSEVDTGFVKQRRRRPTPAGLDVLEVICEHAIIF